MGNILVPPQELGATLDTWTPMIDMCNNNLGTIDGGIITEGCILNGVLQLNKNRAECVIDETKFAQTALYCDGCSSTDSCNIVHIHSTEDPPVGICNKELRVTDDEGTTTIISEEGCIFNGELDTKTKEQCVIDETLEDQTAVYCHECTVSFGCKVAASSTNVVTTGPEDVDKVMEFCYGADEANPDTHFCLAKWSAYLSMAGVPDTFGVVFSPPNFNEEDGSRQFCQAVKGTYWCDGTAASVAASQGTSQGDVACLASVEDAAALAERYAELQVKRVDAACATGSGAEQ